MAEVLAEVAFTATADIDTAARTTATFPRVRFAATADLSLVIQPRGDQRRVIITGIGGAALGELESAKVGTVTKELNRPDSYAFAILMDDPKAGLVLDVPLREAQIWRGDQLLTWGPMNRPAADKTALAVSGAGTLWYLSRRNFGRANRHNYINNGDFEAGLAGWAFGTNNVLLALGLPGGQATPPIHDIVTFPTITGGRALRLQNYTDGADAFASQSFLWTVDPDASPAGDLFTVKAYVFVESFTAAAYEGGRGLYLERFSTTELDPRPEVQAINPGQALSLQHVFVTLDADTPLGVWQRFEIALTTPPKAGEPEIINVRLYAPNGVCYWDATSLTLDESTRFNGVDQALIAKGIVEHLQDPTFDKSDLAIGTNTPLTGVLRSREYKHSDHPPGLKALDEFTALDNGFDYDVVATARTRTFTTYFPGKGTRRPNYTLELGKNIADFAWAFDGEAAASSIIVLGQGDGPDREEGFAIDPTAFAGGLTLEEVFSSPPETPIELLDNIAAEQLAAARNPVILTVKTYPTIASWFGILATGDVVPVRIRRGKLLVNDDYRIGRMSLNPDDTIDWVLNRRDLPR